MKNLYVLFLFIMLLFISGCSLSTPDNTFSIPEIYYDYKDIPGVSEQDIQDIEALKSSNPSFIIGMPLSTEAYFNDNNEIEGYTVLLCQWLSRLFDIPFTTQIYEWEDLMNGLYSYDIDFTGDLTKTPKRSETFYMTDTMVERSIGYFHLTDSEDLKTISKERIPIFAFLTDSTGYDYIINYCDIDFKPVFVNSLNLAAELLLLQEIDAFFADSTSEVNFDEYPSIKCDLYFPPIYSPVSLSTCNPELEPMIRVIQKYLDQGAIYHLTSLHNKGYEQYITKKLRSRLTVEELQFLDYYKKENIPILFGAENDNYPISFYNQQDQEWQGIAHDILAEISSLTALTFQPYNSSDTEWGEILNMLDNGQISFITSLVPTNDRKDSFLWSSKPYLTDYYALISLSSKEDISLNQIFYSRIGALEKSAYKEVFHSWFPDHPSVTDYATTLEAFAALERGDIDFVMSTRNQLLGVTHYLEKPYFKINTFFQYECPATFGFHLDQDILCSIISKTQDLIDVNKISDRWIRKTYDYQNQIASARLPLFAAVACLLAVILLLFIALFRRSWKFNIQLENLVSERTAELAIQTANAKVASKAKSDFLSRMSHEIRTPLNAIVGTAQIAQQVPDQSAKNQKLLSQVLSASDHLMSILNDILDMSKIESGKFQIASEPFPFTEALEEVALIITRLCEKQNIHFESNYQQVPKVTVNGDRLRLKQVLINLLSNGVKFNKENGSVWLTINICNTDAKYMTARFSIKDNGIGMTQEEISHLFLPFEQSNEKIAAQYGGTGLGLAISQNLVHMMGGAITVKSQPGKGSEFVFSLTLEKVEDRSASITATYSTPNLTGKRILLAEDVEINRCIVVELLENTNVIIEEAVDGRQAVESFIASPPGYYSLIFMDIQMPFLSGYEATKQIRSSNHPDAQTIPIIAMTANAFQDDIEKSFACGMNGHIAKPINLQHIYRELTKIKDS